MTKVTDKYLEERRQEILDAARKIFVEKGYASATVNDIAAEAGISAGNIYRYFPGKADLIAEVACGCYENDRQRWEHQIETGATPGQAFYALGEEVRAEFNAPEHQAEAILRIESYLAASRDPELRQRLYDSLQDSVGALAEIIQRAQDSGELSADLDARQFATFLSVVGSGIGTMQVSYGDAFDADAAWSFLIRLVMPYFSPEALQAAGISSTD